jgi:hypothetical protein
MEPQLMRTFFYTMGGRASGGQTWKVRGTVQLDAGVFAEAFEMAMRDSFRQLTGGKAVFGKPGLGCSGPYEVTSFTLTCELPSVV